LIFNGLKGLLIYIIFLSLYKEIKRLYPSLNFLIAIRLYAEGENLEPRFGGAYFFVASRLSVCLTANCGKILYDSKRTKTFSQSWIAKLKAEDITAKANFCNVSV